METRPGIVWYGGGCGPDPSPHHPSTDHVPRVRFGFANCAERAGNSAFSVAPETERVFGEDEFAGRSSRLQTRREASRRTSEQARDCNTKRESQGRSRQGSAASTVGSFPGRTY